MQTQFAVFVELTVRMQKKLSALERMKEQASVEDAEFDEDAEREIAISKLDEDLSGEALSDALFNANAALREGLA